MRANSTARERLQYAQTNAVAQHLRVEVKDSGGTWRDLSSYPGFDAVLSAAWREGIDDPHATAEVTLLREQDGLSLAPLMQTSALNLDWGNASYAALLDLTRELRISIATVAADGPAPVSGDWMVCFHGRIDQIDAAAGETLRLTCRDLGGQLADAWIETERVYSHGTVSTLPVSMRVWQPGMTLVLNEYILPSETKRNGRFYKVTTAGTGGTSEPAWPTSSTVADGTATLTHQGTVTTTGHIVETVMRNILDDNGFSAVTLQVPSASTWALKHYKQDRTSVLEALRALALNIAWDVRYKWYASASEFRLHFFQPDRAKATTDWTFGSDDYEDVRRLGLDISGIRNVVRVNYPDASDLDAAGNPKRKFVDSTDSTSVSRFGRRFAEVSEKDASQIDTSTEAQALADGMRKDLAWPLAEQVVALCYGWPWVELGDRYAFTANGRHYSTTQTLAVVGFEHRAERGVMRTELTCRGQPAGAYSEWHERSANNNREDVVDRDVFTSQSGITVSTQPVVGGVRISVTSAPLRGTEEPSFEYHVGSTSTFTVNSSSLKAVSKARTVELTDLIPGATYYARVVPVFFDGGMVRGQPSDGVSFVPSRGMAAHAKAEVEWGRAPINGGFETRYDTNGPPDHWFVTTGTWGTQFGVVDGSGAVSGDRYLKYLGTQVGAGSPAVIESAIFTVEEGRTYDMSFWVKRITTPGGDMNGAVGVKWLDSSQALISDDSITFSETTPTTWTKYTDLNNQGGVQWLTAPSGAKFARMFVWAADSTVGGEDATWGVDQLRLEPLLEANPGWYNETNVTLQASWTSVGSPYQVVGYMRDKNGFVHIRGLIKPGTTTDGTTLFTLASGYRPAATEYFPTMGSHSNGTRYYVLIVIASDGTVKIYGAGSIDASGWVTLAGICFDTR